MNLSKVDVDSVIEAAQESMYGLGNDGFCIECGECQGGCEPDARKYTCESCGKRAVYGAEELLIYLA
jgi:Zn finger protein HypA/HybF involved in hydrogenase expression